MSNDHATINSVLKRFTPPRSTDERGRLLPMTEEERLAWVEEGNRMLDELAEMTDETDTPELWDEVLRNLGVDPVTGRGLSTRRGVRIGRTLSRQGDPAQPEGATR
jgi:hypothetical protein